ncbi:hypothetical protein CI688_06280, partial [Shigella sonnei]
SAQIREILISESIWEEMTCLFAPSLVRFYGLTKGALQRNEWEFHVTAGYKGTGSKLNRKKTESYFQ